MRNGKRYTLETTPNDHQETQLLEEYGFEQEFNSSPYTFKTDSTGELMNVLDLLEEEGYAPEWTLTKKEGE